MTLPHSSIGPSLPKGSWVMCPLAQLIRTHSPSVGAYLQRLGVPSGDLDDVKQRIWLTALRWRARLLPGCERAFLFSVARREAGHTHRSYQRRAEVAGVDITAFQSGGPLADELLLRREQLQQAHAALETLEPSLRSLYITLETGAATAAEVARSLGIPLGTAKSRWRRARRECMREARAGVARVDGA